MAKFSYKEINDIKWMTKLNNHTEARVVIASKIKSSKEKLYREILKKRARQGGLTQEQWNKGYKADATLFKELKNKVSKSEYDAIMRGL